MAYHTLAGIQIHDGCRWTDEFDWSPVESFREYGITGSQIIDVGIRQAGRPITLQASDTTGWLGMTRAKVTQLYTLAASPATRTLTLSDGRSFDVIFAPGQDAITARPLADRESPPTDWPYIVTIRLITV
jgi:hypothetical protein